MPVAGSHDRPTRTVLPHPRTRNCPPTLGKDSNIPVFHWVTHTSIHTCLVLQHLVLWQHSVFAHHNNLFTPSASRIQNNAIRFYITDMLTWGLQEKFRKHQKRKYKGNREKGHCIIIKQLQTKIVKKLVKKEKWHNKTIQSAICETKGLEWSNASVVAIGCDLVAI